MLPMTLQFLIVMIAQGWGQAQQAAACPERLSGRLNVYCQAAS
jgi:hypothetical protein